MLWFCGISTLRVIQLPNIKTIKEIENFLPFYNDDEFGIALRGVTKNHGKQILVAFVISSVFSFVFYEKGLEPDPQLGSQIMPQCNNNCFNASFSWNAVLHGALH